jgi:HPt (histidine-containing phosphotransfer) domain-containing protein
MTRMARLEELPPPRTGAQPIDLAHLEEMTLGDRKLEWEVLELFDRQAQLLLARMQEVDSAAIAGLAHKLIGSARGIGAWRVAAAAEALEAAITTAEHPALDELTAAVAEARRAIAGLLRVSSRA